MSNAGLTRRELLTRGTGAVVAAGAATAVGYLLYDPEGDAGLPKPSEIPLRLPNYFADIDFPASNPRISVATGSEAQIARMVRAAVDGLDPSMGMKRFISSGDVVLIKPNVGFDRPVHLGATTHPEVVRGVIRLCKQAGAREIIVSDNPVEAPATCFSRSKIQEVADAEGARVMLPSRADFKVVTIRDHTPDPGKGEALDRWPILYSPLEKANKVIGVAPVKDHSLSNATMSLKNWYGLLGGRRNQLHQAIHDTISDLALMMSPTLVIADGTRVMMSNGPTGGRISDVKPGGVLGKPTIVAAVDPVACDAWCHLHLLGRDPAKLTYLELAQEKIEAQIAAGWNRFGRRDWREYDTHGKIAVTGM